MSRVARGALTLKLEVEKLRPEAVVEIAGLNDGFGVYRTLKFDKDTGDWLVPLLEQIRDKRVVAAHDRDGEDALYVDFSSKPVADNRDPFNLASAEVVVAAQKIDEKPAPKKRAAKKSVSS